MEKTTYEDTPNLSTKFVCCGASPNFDYNISLDSPSPSITVNLFSDERLQWEILPVVNNNSVRLFNMKTQK